MADALKLQTNTSGVWTSKQITEAFETGILKTESPLAEEQIQPASLDLRLGKTAYRVRAGFLPGKSKSVMDRVSSLGMHEVSLEDGGVLEKGAVYIIPLLESVDLPEFLEGVISPKSSTGRLDILTRLITDNGTTFDRIPKGYTGPLYVEVTPLTFSIVARTGDRLNQLRLRTGFTPLSEQDMANLHNETPLIFNEQGTPEMPVLEQGGIWMSVDLEGIDGSDIVAYRARKHAPVLDLRKIGHYNLNDFWEPITKPHDGGLVLNPEDFYIMVSREKVSVPGHTSCEMMPYETTAGELRVHYAGFFDPGFGMTKEGSSVGVRAVLEVRSHDVPFVLEHGQKICRMVYEPLAETPDILYGIDLSSNYASQGLKLAKQFKMEG